MLDQHSKVLANRKLRHEKFELNEVDLLGLRPLARASQNGHLPIVKLLLQQPEICVNAPNQLAVSPLLAACHAGKQPIVDLLLRQASSNVNQKSPEGKSALQVAIEMDQFDIAGTLVAWRDSNVSNSPNLQGWSALMLASARGSYGMVQK
jgi:ankyrin repeat protein